MAGLAALEKKLRQYTELQHKIETSGAADRRCQRSPGRVVDVLLPLAD